MKTHIFKCQRSIVSSHPGDMMLVYNSDRSIQGEFPLSRDHIDNLFGPHYKVYAEGTYDEKTTQVLITKVLGPNEPKGWQLKQ